MKPQGRRYQSHNAKWKVKDHGKNIAGWWENVISPSNKRARVEGKQEILDSNPHEELNTYFESELKDEYELWGCLYKGTDTVTCPEGICISCDWDTQHDAATGWDDPNFIEAWDYEEYWSKYVKVEGEDNEST